MIRFLVLYLLFLKATATTFSGLASLPLVRADLVAHRHVLTDRQLAAAVAAGQTTPGPLGLYVVSAGYFIDGVPGAAAACLALMTPAFFVIPLLKYLGRRSGARRVRDATQALTLTAAGLIFSAMLPLAATSLTGAVPVMIAIASFLFLLLTRRDTMWVILFSGLAGLLYRAIG